MDEDYINKRSTLDAIRLRLRSHLRAKLDVFAKLLRLNASFELNIAGYYLELRECLDRGSDETISRMQK